MDNTEHIIQELRSEKWEMAQEIERLREALHQISLCSQNSMRSKQECGDIARFALQQKESE